ncbi:Ank1 [Symbiodinium necroappetens]|uniref:Ank1 protein n=1 Tax=Symbiodinium necroappetens TaxID=1628268 RepID=A0A812IZ72_9DINO|nr:Ank1 [Symbiodinium necroappetens]
MPRGAFSTAAESSGLTPEPRREKASAKKEEAPSASQASPLAFASRIGDLIEVKRLLDAKSDPNSVDAVGETPLFEAAASGDVSVLASLLLAGADPQHQSFIGSLASDLCSSEACATLLRLCSGEEASPAEREEVLQALAPNLRPPIRSFMQSLSGEPDSDDEAHLDIDFDAPPALIRKNYDDEDGDDWTFAAAMVEQARKSRAKQRHKRNVPVEPIELVVCHALNDRQTTLKLMSNSTFADAKDAIYQRLKEEGKYFRKFYFVKKERSTYQAYKDTDQIGHIREVRLVGADLPLESNAGALLFGDLQGGEVQEYMRTSALKAEAFGARVPLRIAASQRGGRGVFAGAPIAAGETVEVCPVLALRRDHIDADCAGMRYFFTCVQAFATQGSLQGRLLYLSTMLDP